MNSVSGLGTGSSGNGQYLTEGIEVRSLPVWGEMYEFVVGFSTGASTDASMGERVAGTGG